MILAFIADPGNMTLGSTANTGLTYAAPPPPPLSAQTVAALSTNSSNGCMDGALSDSRQPPFEPLKMMRAIHVENFGGPEVLQLKFNLIVPPLTKTQARSIFMSLAGHRFGRVEFCHLL